VEIVAEENPSGARIERGYFGCPLLQRASAHIHADDRFDGGDDLCHAIDVASGHENRKRREQMRMRFQEGTRQPARTEVRCQLLSQRVEIQGNAEAVPVQ
jgi:hypothetical protein